MNTSTRMRICTSTSTSPTQHPPIRTRTDTSTLTSTIQGGVAGSDYHYSTTTTPTTPIRTSTLMISTRATSGTTSSTRTRYLY